MPALIRGLEVGRVSRRPPLRFGFYSRQERLSAPRTNTWLLPKMICKCPTGVKRGFDAPSPRPRAESFGKLRTGIAEAGEAD